MPLLAPHKRRYILLGAIALLAAANILIWYAAAREDRHGLLTVALLNIGQGDAIYIESPTGAQMIIDGGPDRSLLTELGKVMPFYDRSIDAIMVTNPDKDHYAGFIDLLDGYSVGQVFEPGTRTTTATYATLEREIEAKHVPDMLARRGMTIDLGGGALLHILFPDQDVSTWTTNDGSIVAKLTYGTTSVLLTGDSTHKIEDYLIALDKNDPDELRSTVLKAGHHGSRTSTSPEYVAAIKPQMAMISDGVMNRYGHPAPETLDTLASQHVPVLRTDLRSTIILKSDGAMIGLVH